jgi:RNase P/RNase MRP subunit p29
MQHRRFLGGGDVAVATQCNGTSFRCQTGQTKFGRAVKENKVLLVQRNARHEQLVIVKHHINFVLRYLSGIYGGFQIIELLVSDFLIWIMVKIVGP